MIGKVGRTLYQRGSRALHAGTQQKEFGKIVDCFLDRRDRPAARPVG